MSKFWEIKNSGFILMIIILSNCTWCYAQFVQEIYIPEKPTSTYEKLISTYFIKNTKRFGLSGNVKTIKETKTKKSTVEAELVANDTCYYEFLPNGNLFLFKQNDLLLFILKVIN